MLMKYLAGLTSALATMAASGTVLAHGGHPEMVDHALAHALYAAVPLTLSVVAGIGLAAYFKASRSCANEPPHRHSEFEKR